MRRWIPAILSLVVLSWAVPVCAAAGTSKNTVPNTPNTETSYARVVRLSIVDGAVSIAHAGDSFWTPALANMPIQEGDTLASADGFAEIEFENGSVAYVAQNSTLQFTKLSLQNGGRITETTLTQGTASFYASPANEDSFSALTPDLAAAIASHAQFRMDVTTAGSSVSVYAGSVSVSSSAGTNELEKGQTLAYRTDNNQGVSITRNLEADAFDRWANSQTQIIRAATYDSQGYMSSPYSYGMADLDGYGSWLECPGIGTCWAPMGMGAGWMPYADGFWSPFDGLGMTWISYEPWGWMPYHFGAWAMSPDYGWVWTPGDMQMAEWQPAMVAWVQSGSQVGWVPLSPMDKAGQPPVNLRHAFIVSPPATAVGAAAINRAVAVADVHATVAMAHAPAGFVSRTAPSFTRSATPGVGFAAGRGPQSVVFDHATRGFVNAPASAGFRAPATAGARNTFSTAPAPMSMPNRSYGGSGGGFDRAAGGSGAAGGQGAQGSGAGVGGGARGGTTSAAAPAAPTASAPSAGAAAGHH